MLKRVNTNLFITNLFIINDKNEKIVVTMDENYMIVGDYKIKGNARYLVGDASNITGDVSNIYGDVSNIYGDVTGAYGNLSQATAKYLKKHNLTKLENKIDVSLLID